MNSYNALLPNRSKKNSKRSQLNLHPEPPKLINDKNDVKFNPHDLGIFVNQNPLTRGEPKNPEEFKLYCTGTIDLLLKGIDIKLDMEMNPDQCRSYIFDQIRSKDLLGEYEDELYLDVYLPGGIRFIGGKLSDLYNNTAFKPKPVIYAVLYCRNDLKNNDEQLDQICIELCNATNNEKRGLISPLCESSDRGLADVACLLGYLNKGGINSDKLIKASASIIHFPPLIIALNRIFERCDITGHDIIAVTSSLFTFFRYLIPVTVEDRYVFEFALRCCTYISSSQNIPNELPIMTIELNEGEEEKPVDDDIKEESLKKSDIKFLKDLHQPETIYFWQEDVVGITFGYLELEKPSSSAIEFIHNTHQTFRPILPIFIQYSTYYQIIRGEDYNSLYLTPTPTKNPRQQNYVDITDPMTGMTDSFDMESFYEKADAEEDINEMDTAQLVDVDNVEDIIDVCFDESGSMLSDIDGMMFNPYKSESFSRLEIAIQYLSLFVNRAYGFRISCILGLISFNNKITNRCPLSPLVRHFEEKGLKHLSPKGATHLWDAISESCNRIVKYSTGKDNKPIFENARKRILVISDGDDHTSEKSVVEVAKQLKRHDILLDSIILTKSNECNMLATLSHITGGLSFKATDSFVNDLKIFEQSAFLCSKRRAETKTRLIPNERDTLYKKITEDKITEEFLNKLNEHTVYDSKVKSSDNITMSHFSTPKHVCYVNRERRIPNSRQRRILRELHYAALVNDPNSNYYDSDMVIYTYYSSLDQWAVFLKGPVNSPYENKWWYLLVSFPPLYPCQPPIFRFVSIPYHLNVSSEGQVCLNLITKSYMSTTHVIDILQDIKQIFLMTFESTPIQIEIFDTYISDRDEYERKAKESTINNAKDEIKDFFPPDKFLVNDEYEKGFSLGFSNAQNLPKYMVSQISGKLLKKENLILASTNVYYDRDELINLLETHQNPICVITGKPLTDDLNKIKSSK